jgi:tetratricopeptide (TPR) repeat protein
MNTPIRLIATFALGLPLLACSPVENPEHNTHTSPSNETPMGEKRFAGQIAPILDGMGEHGFDLLAASDTAKLFFNQALALTYGFNHVEAGRSYQQVAALEPTSAIAYWGQALVLGPNINGAMESSSVAPAYEAIQKALSLETHASDKERGLIQALSARYSNDESMSDRTVLDEAYADAMRSLVARYPEDPNIRTLLAEALMVIHAWDYWMGDGRPKEWTPEILEVLETGLTSHPNHAGLIHYYIHAVEASKNPGRALAGADTLRDLVPGAGHLVHMPSHIYIRTGRYQDGVEANEKAIVVDNNYIAQCRQQGIYPLAYVPHNRHFLWAMASMQGNSKKAIAAAEHMAKHIDLSLMKEPGYGTLQHYWVTPTYAYVRFGHWEKILSAAKPDQALHYPVGVWHYARGIAFAAKGELEKAQEELLQLQSIAADEALKDLTVWGINNAFDVISIAQLILQGELAGKNQNFDEAIDAIQKAATLEDALNYNEPSDWHYPVRQSLGAVLLSAGKFIEAENAYRQDLEVFPENGWSLYGLSRALSEQGKEAEAELIHKRFEQAWSRADIELSASRVL